MTDRRALDFYETPPWMVDLLVANVDFDCAMTYPYSPLVLEPCVGRGNITRGLERHYSDLRYATNDLNPRHEADSHLDATTAAYWETIMAGDPVDFVVTNPPFAYAFDIVRQAVDVARVGVAILLRQTWLEPTEERRIWLRDNPPTGQIVMPRHAFAGAKKDSATTVWYLWGLPILGGNPIVIEPFKGRRQELIEA